MMMTNLLPSSANATSAHSSTTDRYKFVNTAAIVDRFLDKGFQIRSAAQSKVRRQDFAGYQRHLIRLTTPYEVTAAPGDTSNIELLLLNQHLGSGSLIFKLGLYRFICMNGVVVGTDLGVANRVRHFGANVFDLIDETIDNIVTSLPRVAERVSMMTARRMSADESRQFAMDAMTIRGVAVDDERRRNHSAPILLTAKRAEDADDTLWNVFNRTQEHLMSGVSGRRRQGLRRITSPTRDVALNERLWALADSYIAA